jgi:hypothetical protein
VTQSYPMVQGNAYKFDKIADGIYYATFKACSDKSTISRTIEPERLIRFVRTKNQLPREPATGRRRCGHQDNRERVTAQHHEGDQPPHRPLTAGFNGTAPRRAGQPRPCDLEAREGPGRCQSADRPAFGPSRLTFRPDSNRYDASIRRLSSCRCLPAATAEAAPSCRGSAVAGARSIRDQSGTSVAVAGEQTRPLIMRP